MAPELVISVQAVAARIVLWAGAAASTADMMGATLAVTITAVVVRLVLGVRQAVVKIEVGIASWIRVTAALEVVPVTLPILEELATSAIAVV